ncbi:MAG: aminotransferase class V-fold PLP-dependent enzyme [Chloroflexota bacterium]|nr:aminotransferase class V-fold PLP-dependent enzyme [Chloroflexota bacterium]
MTTLEVRALFHPEPGTAYLDAATYGLPPLPTVDAMETALHDWQAGRAKWREDWDRQGDVCRALFADLIGAMTEEIALVPTVSVGVAPVFAALNPGDEVVVPADEFTSVLFPLLVAEEQRGIVVRQVAYEALPDAIDEWTRLVAFSLVQSQGGRTAPLADICGVARRHDARVLVDATHAIPFVPVTEHLGAIDVLICHGYKHLLCPRGVGFLYVRRDRWQEIPPIHANWRAADPLCTRSYGGPLSPAPGAARFDVSLDWLAWVGARQSLELLVRWQQEGVLTPVLGLSGTLADRRGLPRPSSSIVAVPVHDAQAALGMLDAAGVRAAAPAGVIRLSPHVYNTADDVERAAALLGPLVTTG